jgi:hypothetical protein
MGMQDNHITDDRVRRFVAALRRFEQDGDESLMELFAPEATATRLDASGVRTDYDTAALLGGPAAATD